MGMSELLVIAVVALLFLGPEKLPDAAKKLSQGIREFRQQGRDLQRTIQDDTELGGAVRDLQSALRGDDFRPVPYSRDKDKEKDDEKDDDEKDDDAGAAREAVANADPYGLEAHARAERAAAERDVDSDSDSDSDGGEGGSKSARAVPVEVESSRPRPPSSDNDRS